MLKKHSTFIKQSIAVIDCFLLIVAFYLSHMLISAYRPLDPIFHYWLMIVGFMGFYLYFAWTRSLFSIMHFNWMKGLFGRIVMIFISAALLGAAILYLFPNERNSRYLYLMFTLLSFVFISFEKTIVKMFIGQFRVKSDNMSPVIIVGRGRDAVRVNHEIGAHPQWGIRVVKMLDLSIDPKEFAEILKTYYVEEVFFSVPRKTTRDGCVIDPLLQICEEMGRPARVFLNILESTYFAQWEYRDFMQRPTLISHTVELDPDQLFFKRLFDIFGASIALIILVIIYPFVAVAIKLTSRGSVFFRQVRVGENGKRFVIYKFRSMKTNAEKVKPELQRLNQCNGAIFKIKEDPRITPVGRIMRKLSIDELPQVINVLKGEMSLVGTRPPTPDEVAMYEKWHHRRICIRPGLTGLWQVSGRSKIKNFDEIVKLDLRYIDNWSIWLDIKIILKTIVVIFERDSAY